MKLTLALILFPAVVFAQPFIVCDRELTNPPTEYQITLPAGQTWLTPLTVPALATGSYGFKADVALAPVGTTSLSVKACTRDATWGVLCSTAATLPLVRPSLPPAPTVQLVAQ